jgi:hypothetical protein
MAFRQPWLSDPRPLIDRVSCARANARIDVMSRTTAGFGLFFSRYTVHLKSAPPACRYAMVLRIVIAVAAVHAVGYGSWNTTAPDTNRLRDHVVVA